MGFHQAREVHMQIHTADMRSQLFTRHGHTDTRTHTHTHTHGGGDLHMQFSTDLHAMVITIHSCHQLKWTSEEELPPTCLQGEQPASLMLLY